MPLTSSKIGIASLYFAIVNTFLGHTVDLPGGCIAASRMSIMAKYLVYIGA